MRIFCNQKNSCIFVTSVPAKPLYNAQIGGPFYFNMPGNYTKQSTLPSDLKTLLKGRGLVIADELHAENYLWNIGYFRFSAYLRPLYNNPKTNHIFKNNATFEQALNMYRFDRKLRLMLFNEIEKIEVAIRSALEWLEGLPESIREDAKSKGFEICKTMLPFTRYINERTDLGMDEWMKQHLPDDDYMYYKST